MSGDGNGYVTQKMLWSVVVGIASVVVSAGWLAWQIHSTQPHPGAMRETEFDRAVQGIEQRFDQIIRRLDRIEENMRK